MRIILDLSDALLREASTRAAFQRTTLTAVLESALRHYLAMHPPSRSADLRALPLRYDDDVVGPQPPAPDNRR